MPKMPKKPTRKKMPVKPKTKAKAAPKKPVLKSTSTVTIKPKVTKKKGPDKKFLGAKAHMALEDIAKKKREKIRTQIKAEQAAAKKKGKTILTIKERRELENKLLKDL
jgi:hypothetical protein